MTDPRFLRIERMIGPEGLERLSRARVVVVGLGAVGSYATEALARAGVGHLRLVDFDVIRPSNINRQLYALESTLGRHKVDVAAARVRDINPRCEVEPLRIFVDAQTREQVLAGPPDVLIDAIDSLSPKVELLSAASAGGIPIISSAGAALRTDPLSIRVAPLSQTHACPLAAKIRRKLRKRGVGIEFPCIYSIEPVRHEPGAPEESGETPVLERGRPRQTLGSLPTLTGIFGLIAANLALERLGVIKKDEG